MNTVNNKVGAAFQQHQSNGVAKLIENEDNETLTEYCSEDDNDLYCLEDENEDDE